MRTKLKNEFNDYLLLMKSVPATAFCMFVVAIVGSNLMANKSINMPFEWSALDCGIVFSWLIFLSMDMLAKRFGARAATQISFTACGINLILCSMFLLASVIPGVWGESYCDNGQLINTALNNTFGGCWYVVIGSTIAFLVSSVVNNYLNAFIGSLLSNTTFKHYAIRSYISTCVGQFIDNLVFALIVSLNFFGWSLTQCFVCSLTGALVELLCEVIFSPVGYKVVTRWEATGVGNEYINREVK